MERFAAKRPSPALVLSMVTLLFAITSTAAALPGRGLVERGDLAKGSVTARALARGAVRSKAIAKHAVTSGKLANDAVTASKLAPFSVGAFALGNTTVVSQPIPDDDSAADFNWTASPTVVAACPARSVLLGGGVGITPSTQHKAFVQTSAPNGDRWEASISTDAAGASPGRVYAVCLL